MSYVIIVKESGKWVYKVNQSELCCSFRAKNPIKKETTEEAEALVQKALNFHKVECEVALYTPDLITEMQRNAKDKTLPKTPNVYSANSVPTTSGNTQAPKKEKTPKKVTEKVEQKEEEVPVEDDFIVDEETEYVDPSKIKVTAKMEKPKVQAINSNKGGYLAICAECSRACKQPHYCQIMQCPQFSPMFKDESED